MDIYSGHLWLYSIGVQPMTDESQSDDARTDGSQNLKSENRVQNKNPQEMANNTVSRRVVVAGISSIGGFGFLPITSSAEDQISERNPNENAGVPPFGNDELSKKIQNEIEEHGEIVSNDFSIIDQSGGEVLQRYDVLLRYEDGEESVFNVTIIEGLSVTVVDDGGNQYQGEIPDEVQKRSMDDLQNTGLPGGE